MDLGYGTLPRLLASVGSSVGAGIDAVIITHKHPDHMLDLHGLFRARWFGGLDAAPIPLYAPNGVVHRLQGLEEDDEGAILEVFDWHPLPDGPYSLGPFELRSWSLPHFVPNAGIRLTADGLVVAYTGDTGPDPDIAELAADADLFIAEPLTRQMPQLVVLHFVAPRIPHFFEDELRDRLQQFLGCPDQQRGIAGGAAQPGDLLVQRCPASGVRVHPAERLRVPVSGEVPAGG
ncbi:MBL fold metallo-hydrolase [Janibacter limosus]|uniref:MBL fold metallo-hydrolase n=1 Tax=Janibacter limosus TaxID=53458 RepID=UPI0035DE7263